MSAFHEIRFPFSLARGAVGGPERRTEIVSLVSGREERNSPWSRSRRRWDAGVGLSTLDDLHDLIAFFEARRGRLHGFRWHDGVDWKSCAPSAAPGALDQTIGIGDGVQTLFQLSKTYGDVEAAAARAISKPVAGTVQIAVAGIELSQGAAFDVEMTSGAVNLSVAPAVGAPVTAGFEFDIPVRFDVDRLDISLDAFNAGEAPNVPVLELLV